MSLIQDQPQNKNFLSPVGFKFSIKKLPYTNFFVQSLNIPGMQFGTAPVDTPFITIPVPGDHIKYRDFNLTFKIDEDMSNYIEIFNWIVGMGFPENFDQYKQIARKRPGSGDGIITDANIIILSSSRNPVCEIDLIDMYPVSLTDVIFDTRDTTIDYIEATATFKFRTMFVKQI